MTQTNVLELSNSTKTNEKEKQLKERDELIRKNWDNVYNSLYYKLSKSWMTNIVKDTNDLVLEGMSYIGDNIDKFDGKKSSFTTWATYICYKRLIDKYRIRHRAQNVFGLVTSATEQVVQDGLPLNDANLLAKLKEILGDDKGAQSALDKYRQASSLSLDAISSQTDNGREVYIEKGKKEAGYGEVDWEDAKEEIKVKIQQAFMQKKINRLQLAALEENIIPKSEGKEYKTFKEIGMQFGLTEAYLAQQVKYSNFTETLNEILTEVGIK